MIARTQRKRIRILLVDDHPVVREGLRSILGCFDEIIVAGEASSGLEALEISRRINPDVVVMDITMPEMNGIEATARLSRDLPACKVLALSMHDNRAYVSRVLRAGARGYILKDSAPKELLQAIEAVFHGNLPISPQAASALVKDRAGGPPALTQREIEVLRFIAQGMTNKEISVALNISVRTVETHRDHLIKKTGRSSVAELTRYAISEGYVDLR